MSKSNKLSDRLDELFSNIDKVNANLVAGARPHDPSGDEREIKVEKHQQVDHLTSITNEFTSVADISAAAAAALNSRELTQIVVDLIVERFKVHYALIYLVNESQDELSLTAGSGEVGRKLVAQDWRTPIDADDLLITHAARKRQGVFVNNVRANPGFVPNDVLPGTQAEIAVPMIADNELMGVLDIHSNEIDAFSNQDVTVQTTLAHHTAVALQNARFYERMQHSLTEAEALYAGSAIIGSSTDLDKILQGLVRSTSLKKFNQVMLLIFDSVWEYEVPKELIVSAIWDRGNIESFIKLGMVFPFEKFIGAKILNRDEVMCVVDILTDERFDIKLRSTLAEAGFSSVISCPLKAGGNSIGIIFGQSSAPLNLSNEELRRIHILTDQAATVAQNLRLIEQSQAALEEAEALYQGSANVVVATSLDDILQALVKSTALDQLDSMKLAFFDQAWETIPPKTAVVASCWEKGRDEPQEPVGTVLELTDNPFFDQFDRRNAVVINDVTTDVRVDDSSREKIYEKGVRGAVLLPLFAAGQWYGVAFGYSSNPIMFTERQIRTINSLVDQAATVVQGLRLQDDMQDRLDELTSLQRLMSREAWMAYQAELGERSGYVFNRINVQPVRSIKMPPHINAHGEGSNIIDGNGKGEYITRLKVGGESIGAIGVQQTGEQVLSPEDEAFLEAISEQVSQALERARLMEQTQKAAVELQAVADVSTATSKLLEPAELLQSVVDLTKTNFGLYHAHVYLLDEIQKNLTLSAGAGEVGRRMTAEGWVISIDDKSLVAKTAREKRGLIIADTRQEADFLPNPLLPDTLSEMAVPLIVGNTLLGVFDVQSDKAGRFTEEDVRTYNTLASQVAVALQNAQLYAEQLDTVERLRELDNMKSAFLANMSHELRTPLNSILGFTQVIMEGLDGPLTDLMLSDLELIEKNGQHLLRLINDVLDMAKIEAGRLSISPEPVNLYDLIEEVIIGSSSLARDKDLYVHLDAEPSELWTVTADHVRMRQIFMNLLGNSIKFTDVGGISVEFDRLWAAEGEDEDKLQVRIKDTGIGIPSEKTEEIFEAFSQVDSSTTRKAGGTGLGLPISRRLVEMHGGRLWAESEGITGEGSIFYLELPIGLNTQE